MEPAYEGEFRITTIHVAWKLAEPGHRNSFILWQVLGIADLVLAVSLGTTARWFDPQGASMVAMTVLPLSLVPTFLVPLFVIFHVISIAQARTWKMASARTRQTATPVQHSAI
jgi:hypothetical protein